MPLAFLDVAASAAAQSASTSSAAVLSENLLCCSTLLALALDAPLSQLSGLAALASSAVDGLLLPELFSGCKGQDEGNGEICIGLYVGVIGDDFVLSACDACDKGPFVPPLSSRTPPLLGADLASCPNTRLLLIRGISQTT